MSYYEPRQDRKVATVIDMMCAEDLLVGLLFLWLESDWESDAAQTDSQINIKTNLYLV